MIEKKSFSLDEAEGSRRLGADFDSLVISWWVILTFCQLEEYLLSFVL